MLAFTFAYKQKKHHVMCHVKSSAIHWYFTNTLLYTISKQKHQGVKKERPRTKTDLAEKDMKSNWRPMPPGFDTFESFGHDELKTLLFQVLKAS